MDKNESPRDPDRRHNRRLRSEDRRQTSYISTIFIVISILIIGTVVIINAVGNNTNTNYKNNITIPQTEQDIPQNLTPDELPGAQGQLDLNNIIDNSTTKDDSTETEGTISEDSATYEEDASETAAKVVDLSKMQNPVSSNEITMAFSLGVEPVFSKTFNEFRSDHAGIDLKATIGEEVKCVYDGKVAEIRNDPKLGTTIKVDHGDNVFTEYANLATDVQVSLNDTVKAGQVLAKVGNTALYEISDGSHLHFALLVKDLYTNPTQYIK